MLCIKVFNKFEIRTNLRPNGQLEYTCLEICRRLPIVSLDLCGIVSTHTHTAYPYIYIPIIITRFRTICLKRELPTYGCCYKILLHHWKWTISLWKRFVLILFQRKRLSVLRSWHALPVNVLADCLRDKYNHDDIFWTSDIRKITPTNQARNLPTFWQLDFLVCFK